MESRIILILFFLFSTLGCMEGGVEDETIRIFAAASLTEAFNEMEEAFEESHPGKDIELNFASSNTLKIQIEEGARADIYASANMKYMDELIEKGFIHEAEKFAANQLVVIAPRENPRKIENLTDLSGEIRLVIANGATPIGMYTLSCLEKMEREFGPGFKNKTLSHVVSEEDNVKGVVSKVALGAADAGIVYSTDAMAELVSLEVIPIPGELNVIATNPIGILVDSSSSEDANLFIEFIQSPEGQSIMEKHGFLGVDD